MSIPDEEKVAICTHFLLSSPPGEIKEVLAAMGHTSITELNNQSVMVRDNKGKLTNYYLHT